MNTHTNKPEVVVVTGASAGVGRAIVRAFAKRGAHIGLLARGRAGLEGARKDVEEAGGKALVIPTDVADAQQVEAAAEQVEQAFGPIDIWINVAMASVFSPFKEMNAVDFKRVTEVTYLGQVYGTMAALRRMLPRDRGRIILVGSALAYRGIPLQSAYCGAKHAIQGFSDSLHCELIHDKSNVKLSMVQLPAVNTPQFSWVKSRLPNKAQPVPPIYQPEVIADAVTYIADHYRRELFIGLSTVIAIEGNKIAPWFGDWYLGRTGYKSQQTDQPEDPHRPNNLWHPVDEDHDHGAHGAFDKRARDTSRQLWADTHRGILALVGVGIASVAAAVWLRRGQS
jgi:short-subunit dehydrogenase